MSSMCTPCHLTYLRALASQATAGRGLSHYRVILSRTNSLHQGEPYKGRTYLDISSSDAMASGNVPVFDRRECEPFMLNGDVHLSTMWGGETGLGSLLTSGLKRPF